MGDSTTEKESQDGFKPHILIAMPSLKDGYFDKSVILLCEYNKSGAMGFVINSASTTSIDDLLGELGLAPEPSADAKILIGGPVQSELCWVVHSPDFEGKSTTSLNDSLSLSAAQEVLTGIAEGQVPFHYILGVGYSGWGPGQLDKEIEQGAWWLAPIDPLSVLELPIEGRWEQVMEDLGLNTSYAAYSRA